MQETIRTSSVDIKIIPANMIHLSLIQSLFVVVGLMCLCANATVVHNLTSTGWEGVELYIAVKREAIQKKLDAFHSSVSSKCDDGPNLFIPKTSVLTDLQHTDHHPVFIDVGYLTAYDFEKYLEDNPNPCVSIYGLGISLTIPFLSGSSTGRPVYALALSKLYERSRGDIPKVNTIYPFIPVDEIKMSDYGAVVTNGSDEMRLSFNRLNHPCKPPTLNVTEEFKEFELGNFQFGLPSPDFSFCDRYPFDSDFCINAERMKCSVNRYAPNICQIWKPHVYDHCVTTVEVEYITSGFRDFMLLGDDPINILASDTLTFKGSVGLKYPCQE